MTSRKKKILIALLGCGSLALASYFALPYVLPNTVIRHDPSHRRVVTAIAQGIGAETQAAMGDRMNTTTSADIEAILDLVMGLEDEWERECALELVRALPDSGRIPTSRLHKSLTDPDERVAFWSANLLGRIGSRESTPHLLRALSDERPRVVLHSAEALLSIYSGTPEFDAMKQKVMDLTKDVLEIEPVEEELEEELEEESSNPTPPMNVSPYESPASCELA